MSLPANLQYTSEHEWVAVDGDVARIGITAYAADKLGDVVFVELPAVGSAAVAGRVIGEIESTKSVGELYAPFDGEVTAVNDTVADDPSLVNSDPFGAGWLVEVRFTELGTLLSADEYAALTAE